jgi:hypothetical protein
LYLEKSGNPDVRHENIWRRNKMKIVGWLACLLA